jgi:hypothetical protein
MASLRSIVVIQGTPAMTAVALRGLVQSAGHEVWIESSSDSRVWPAVGAAARIRSSGPSGRSTGRGSSRLTGKDNWKKQPESMLVARATSEVAAGSPPTPAGPAVLGGGDRRHRSRRSRSGRPAAGRSGRRRGTHHRADAGPGRLAFLSAELGREIESSKDVTKAEAMRLLDGFAAARDADEPPLDES